MSWDERCVVCDVFRDEHATNAKACEEFISPYAPDPRDATIASLRAQLAAKDSIVHSLGEALSLAVDELDALARDGVSDGRVLRIAKAVLSAAWDKNAALDRIEAAGGGES